MQPMKVKPAPGRAVRDPNTHGLLPEDGREVNENDLYWARRLRDGDVVPADDPPPTKASATEGSA
jgi:Protein of unknown function (DUF2635)